MVRGERRLAVASWRSRHRRFRGVVAAFLLAALTLLAATSWGAGGLTAEPGTVFLLQVDPARNQLVDDTRNFKAMVTGGTVVEDSRFGKCLRLGPGSNNGITVSDAGRMDLSAGFTIEAWVYLEEEGEPNPGGVFAAKIGSFWSSIKDHRLNHDWTRFPVEKVATSSTRQYKEYPVDGEAFYGATPLPVNRWVRLALSYDRGLRAIRTFVDGGIDRTRYLAREGEVTLLSDPRQPLLLLKGMRNVRVAAVRLSRGGTAAGALPALEAYVQQLPYAGEVAVTIDHLRPDLALPVEVALIWESPRGDRKMAERAILRTRERRDLVIEAPSWKGALHTLSVRAYAGEREVFSKSVRVANPPAGKLRIERDRSISVAGTRFFPLAIYHAFPDDYRTLAELGFNIVFPRGLRLKHMGLGGSDEQTLSDIGVSLDEAQKQKLFLIIEGNSVFGNLNRVPRYKDHPALLAWAGFDEPWGSLEKVQESYNVVKLLDPSRPIFCTQNNPSRFAETAEGADILACDPYPLPNVSLRLVADRTRQAVRAVGGLKPVWTILDQYGGKRPSREELRCMAYLAIISGANGLGFYAWDERLDRKNGWYTKEHPEDLATLRSVLGELKSLERVLLTPNSGTVTFGPGNSALHAAVKEAGGKRYLLLASDSRREEKATLSVPGVDAADLVPLGKGGAVISIRKGVAAIKLPPLAAGGYEIREAALQAAW